MPLVGLRLRLLHHCLWGGNVEIQFDSDLYKMTGWLFIFVLSNLLLVSIMKKEFFIWVIEKVVPNFFLYVVTFTLLIKIKRDVGIISFYSIPLKRYVSHDSVYSMAGYLRHLAEVIIPLLIWNLLMVVGFILYCPVYEAI